MFLILRMNFAKRLLLSDYAGGHGGVFDDIHFRMPWWVHSTWASFWIWWWSATSLGKNIPHLFATEKPGANRSNRHPIDNYDDLLLLGHRFVTQLQVFASGEHFNFVSAL